MSRRLISSQAFAMLASAILLFASIGCDPGTLTAPSSAPDNVVDSPNFITLLSTSKGALDPAMTPSASSVVSADEGGRVVCGPFRLDFPAGALDEDTEITMNVIDDGTLGIELGPHGIQFNVPVTLSMNLEGTSAEGMASQSSTLWFDEDDGIYIMMPKIPSQDDNILKAQLEHFSKYNGVINP